MIAMATMSSKGQVTVPVKVRRELGLGRGAELVFVEEGGRYYVENAARLAFVQAQAAFAGEADRVGLSDPQQVVDLVREVRRQRWEVPRAGDA